MNPSSFDLCTCEHQKASHDDNQCYGWDHNKDARCVCTGFTLAPTPAEPPSLDRPGTSLESASREPVSGAAVSPDVQGGSGAQSISQVIKDLDGQLRTGDQILTAAGELLLVGDINNNGGVCDCCPYPSSIHSPDRDKIVKVVRNSWVVWKA